MPPKKILFVIGSPNQTSQMHQVSCHMEGYECIFTQLFSESWLINAVLKTGILDTTILGGEFRRKSNEYLKAHGLKSDYAFKTYKHTDYALAVLCSDLLVTKSIKKMKTVFVQEGMTDPITPWGRITKALKLDGYMAGNTSYNGSSDLCDIYCVASEGYKKQFAHLGTDINKIVVTGIPNYDNVAAFLQNDFPLHGYVMVATSDIRETFKTEDRPAFIQNCVKIANGRQLLFKLHPNEQKERAIAEIKANAPENTLIYTDGKTEHMIANCDELITQFSTVVYIGIALGKKVHSYFDLDQLHQLTPIQNNGTSAKQIADICKQYVEFKGSKEAFLKTLPQA